MPRTYSSKEFRRAADAVSEFIVAAETYQADRDNRDLRTAVAEAAGRAGGASAMAGMGMAQQSPTLAGGRRVAYDPIVAWDAQLDPFADPLAESIDFAYQVRGRLETLADDAVREERSLIGWVASIVGFPGQVRRHLEDRGYSSGTQTAGFVLSIVAQLAVGLFVAWIVYTIGWS